MRYLLIFRTFALLALLLKGATVQAQSAAVGQEGAAGMSNLRDLVMGVPAVVPHGSGDGVVGSPYADARWLPARIRVASNPPLPPVLLKYDVLDRRLLMRSPARATDSLQLDDARVASFMLQEPATSLGSGRQRQFHRFEEAPLPNDRPDYVEVLHEGHYVLLMHRRKTMRKADFQGAYSTGRRFDEIEDHTTYYLRTPEATLLPVKLTLKSLQAAMPTLAADLKTAAARTPETPTNWAAVLDAVDPAPAK